MDDIYSIKITEQAENQLSEIMTYIAEELCAPNAALNLISKLEKAMGDLEVFPERHPLIDEEPWKFQGIRKMIVNNFLMYYWTDKKNKEVQVLAVLYYRRNQLIQLKNIDFKDIPNDVTLDAIREAEEMEKSPESTKTYSNIADLMAALNDSAKASGTSEMTLDEISAEISQHRKERRERKEKQ